MNSGKLLRTPFLQATTGRLFLIFRKLCIQAFNSKQICSLDQYCWQVLLHSRNSDIFFFSITRSSCPEVFCKKGVLKNFIKFRGKHRCFPVNFVKFLRTSFFIEHLWWLLLYHGT